MKYRYLGKTYSYGSCSLAPMEPGDEWIAEGVVRFHLPAILIDIERKPESFTRDRIFPEDYKSELKDHVGELGEDDCSLNEPVIMVEYGPDDWRVIDGWGRINRALELEMDSLPAVKLPSEQAMRYLVEEEDVRRFIEHWNFKAAYWERRDRVNEFLKEDRPEYTEIHVDAEATWEAILAAAAEHEIELSIRWNRWFAIRREGAKLFICEAKHMAPVCPLTFDRQIRKKEFMEVFPLYEEWEMAAEEGPIRDKARRITISYEYIFSMIRQYASEKK